MDKRRSVSAATASATTFISLTGKNSRSARTNSSSAISMRSKSSTQIPNTKRSHSPSSIILVGSNKNPSQRKKQKVSHHWALFGKSEQKLVSIDVRNLRKDLKRKESFVRFRLTNRRFIAIVIHQFDMSRKRISSNRTIVFYYVLRMPNKIVLLHI